MNKVNPNDPYFGFSIPGDEKLGWQPESEPGIPIRLQIAKDVMCAMISASDGWVSPIDAKELSSRSLLITDHFIEKYNQTADNGK